MKIKMSVNRVFAVATLLALSLSWLWFSLPFSDGERSGIIYKVSYKGDEKAGILGNLFCKTWEAEMLLGGGTGSENGGAGGAGRFQFTVPYFSWGLLEEIQKADRTKKYVTIKYIQPYHNIWCTTQSGYFVQSIIH